MKHFKVQELVDPDTYAKYGDAALQFFDVAALTMLDDLREFFACPVTVNNWHAGGSFKWRGLRNPSSPVYSAGSMHSKGRAFDCDVQGYTAEQAREKIIQNKDNPQLKGIMRIEADVNWLHIDNKPVSNRIYLFKV